MAIERRRHFNRQLRTLLADLSDQFGQVAFEVQSNREEIGYDKDAVCTLGRERFDSAVEIGLSSFEKRGSDQGEIPAGFDGAGDDSHCFIRTFDTGAVGENNNTGRHNSIVALDDERA